MDATTTTGVPPAAAPDTTGSVGLNTQMPGQPTTVTGIAMQTGGIDRNGFMQPSIDEQLFSFRDFANAPLLEMMLKWEQTPVDSPKVMHFMIDEERSFVTTASAVTQDTSNEQFVLPLVSADKKIPAECQTLLVPDVSGYDEHGVSTPNIPIMLYVVGKDATTGNPIVIAVNGPRAISGGVASSTPGTPAIPAGTEIMTMCNMLYETQATVPPKSIVPQPIKLNLQKTGVTDIISDYYDKQGKIIPFGKAAQFEQNMKEYFLELDRTLLAGVPCELTVNTPKVGLQTAFGTTGLLWQVYRKMQKTGKWTFEEIIAMAKMFFCGEDKPDYGILFCGMDLLEGLQCVDFSNHPEVQFSVLKNETLGWVVSNLHTAFGDIQMKHLPTLDKMRMSNSGLLLGIGKNRIKHYVFSEQHKHNEKIEGEEATSNSTIKWDGLGLKGTCHMLIEGSGRSIGNATVDIRIWGSTTTPTAADVENGKVYYFINDVELSENLVAGHGSMWKAIVTTGETTTLTWVPYDGTMLMGD
jgi:hypothetical protein